MICVQYQMSVASSYQQCSIIMTLCYYLLVL